MLLMSFSRHWKALWSHLALSFRRHTNKKTVSDSRLRVSSEGVRVQEKKERWIIRCCVWWAGDLWFFRKSSSDKQDAFDADFRISLNSVSRKWHLKQKRQTSSKQTRNPRHVRLFPFYAAATKWKGRIVRIGSSSCWALFSLVSKQELYCRQWGQRQQASRKERKKVSRK